MLDSSQRFLIQIVSPVWYRSHGSRNKTALRACSSWELEKVSSLRLVFPLSSDDPWPSDPRDPVAAELLLCPRMFQDISESEPLETDVAFVSIFAHACSVRADIFCKSADVQFQCCKRRHLGREGIDGLLNTGNSGGDHTYGFTEGLDMVVKICESTREW